MTPKRILVTGDFVLDHHIYEGRRRHFSDRRCRGVQVVDELGGAALVHYLLDELKGPVASHSSVALRETRRPALPAGDSIPPGLAAYAVWRPFGVGKDKDPEKAMWRTEDAMGFGIRDPDPNTFAWPPNPEPPRQPDVVTIADGGMGFRDERALWPTDDVLRSARWIVLKTAYPFAAGALWKHLAGSQFRSKLVVIAFASELRKETAWIAEGLSWDSTVESTLAALAPGAACEALACCRHLVIDFGTEGGLWIDRSRDWEDVKAHLVYDAACVEGEHRLSEIRGTAFGALSCLAASVSWRLALAADDESPGIETAIEGGLSATRDLLEKGHGRALAAGEGFPAKRLAKVIAEPTCRYARISFAALAPSKPPVCSVKQPEARDSDCWSILHEALRQQGLTCPEPAWDLAERVARHGPIALGSLPHLSIGNLMSADRREIESLRILRQLILDYKNRPPAACKKPLSIGVFGPPGSGKSFAVKEIARTLLGGEGWLEFNLSQFRTDTTDDLIGAFHQIRDRVLRAQIPVAFFDEFDARNYAWLQYLLAPMQDGAFQEGQITHPIGKCVFIFAGATSWTFESFGPPKKSVDYRDFRMAKGPDFKSRLDGFLNVLGPNRRQLVKPNPDETAYGEEQPDACDIFYPLRRAFVIRAEFGCKPADRLGVDTGVLRGLLRVGTYEHGSRSLAKMIEPLKSGFPEAVRRSLLPPRQQLELHVSADNFLHECAQASPPPPEVRLENLETFAQEIHEAYRRLGLELGWVEPKSKKDVDFAQLAEFYKNSNRAAARRIVATLGHIGLTLRPGRNTPDERELARRQIETNLELLAELEHAGWMAWHLDQGWQCGGAKSNDDLTVAPQNTTHPCLRPYLDLSDEERNKDRNTVRRYLDFAAAAGMKIIPVKASGISASTANSNQP